MGEGRPAQAGVTHVRALQPGHRRNAAAATSTRRALWRALADTGLPVKVATGGRTKWNRHRTGAPKTHTLDALHAGWPARALVATGTGHGTYSRTRTDKYGFPGSGCPAPNRSTGSPPETLSAQSFRPA